MGRPAVGETATDLGERVPPLLRDLRADLRADTAPAPRPAPGRALRGWLRVTGDERLYDEAGEAELAAALGPDLFGGRAPHPAPGFLTGVDVTALAPAAVLPFLRRLSLTAPAPHADSLTPAQLLREPGPVVPMPGDDSAAMLRIPVAEAVPDIVHSVRLGGPGPLEDAPPASTTATLVVWTDVTREQTVRPDAEVEAWLRRASETGTLLVNIDEVFHAGAPMLLHEHYLAARDEALDFAAQHVRLEVLIRFGGVHVDAGIEVPGEPDEPGALAGATDFSVRGPEGEVIVAPAHHPALYLWRELLRVTAARPERELLGGAETMTTLGPVLPPAEAWRRRPDRARTRAALTMLRERFGLTPDETRRRKPADTSSPVTARPGTSAGEVARRLVTSLVRGLIAREGDLHLAAVAPLVDTRPDRDELWVAVLTLVTELAGTRGIPQVRSVTDVRAGQDGVPTPVRLPAAAAALLYRGPHPWPWIGAGAGPDGEPVWLLGELTGPALVRSVVGAPGNSLTVLPEPGRARAAGAASERTASLLCSALRQRVGRVPSPALRPVAPDLEGPRGARIRPWLGELLRQPVGDPAHEARMLAHLGPDLFGFRRPAPEPAFLEGVDVLRIPANRVASFFAGLSLTRLDGEFVAPAPGELAPEGLARNKVSRVRPGRDWGVEGAPPLPARAAIPHVVHGIWVGGPAPENGLLRINFGAAARHYHGQVHFVVWTDLTRSEAARAMAEPRPEGRAAVVRSMLNWARAQGISVVPVTEVFHAGAPMHLWWQYVADMVKLLPRGYSGASDRLRLEIMNRFGGAYVDSDDRFLFPGDEREPVEREGAQNLPAVFAAVARSVHAFTPHVTPPARVNCDVIVAPARHPALVLWREMDRIACSVSQEFLFGRSDLVQRRAAAAPYRYWHRYTVALRAGFVHSSVMRLLGISHSDPRLVRVMGAIREQSARTWTDSGGGRRVAPTGRPLPPAAIAPFSGRLAQVVASLVRRLISRPGDLHLTAVAPVIETMPDPDAAWLALLRFLALLAERNAVPQITSVTRFRWTDDGRPDYVGLPAAAERLLVPTRGRGDGFARELGQTRELAWVLDELVVPMKLVLAPPEGDLATSRIAAASSVVTRAAWLPDGFTGVQLSGRDGRACVGRVLVTPEDVAAVLSGVGPLTGPILLRMAGGPEHGREWFAARLTALLGRPVVVAHEPGRPHPTQVVSSAAQLRARQDEDGERRRRRAAELLSGLRGTEAPQVFDTEPFLTFRPGKDVPMSEGTRDAVSWLRRITDKRLYTAGFEAELAWRMGPDPYRRRVRPARPAWQTVDVSKLPPEAVDTFLRWLDLAGPDAVPAPDAGDLGVRLMQGQEGRVSRAAKDERARAWGQRRKAPRLDAEVVLPHLVHGIWMGGPLPESGGFRANYGSAAREYAGRVTFVLWTDVSRPEALAALRDVDPGPRARGIRSMLDWARDNGVLVVNFEEVFHAGTDTVLWAQMAAERAKRRPRAYAAASDHLRVEIVTQLGGAYVDGDNGFVGGDALPTMFDDVAASTPAFSVIVIEEFGSGGNDVIVAPAGHPAMRLWREISRLQYRLDQPQLFGDTHFMTERYARADKGLLRYSVVHRTGRNHHRVLAAVRVKPLGRAMVRLVPAAIDYHSELSWAPGSLEEKAGPLGPEETAELLLDVVSTLARHLLNRRGNLYLSEVAPVIASLPDPGAAWIAVLTRIEQLRALGAVPAVTSVTDTRWSDEGWIERVDLPPEAEAMLVRYPRPSGWLGSNLNAPGQPAWLSDEAVEPVRLRAPGRAPGRRWAPVEVRRDDTVVGLRYDDGIGRALARVVPPGPTLVWVRRWCGEPWGAAGRITAEQMALDLLRAGLHRRPVMIVTAPGERTSGGGAEAGLGDFASRLTALLGVPVTAVDAPATAPATRRAPQVQTSTLSSPGKREPERRALARRRLRPDPAAVPLDDAVHGGQADARAGELALLVQPLEG
ncbi:hypothetical protein JCM9957A_68600 [Kineosporia succinea]